MGSAAGVLKVAAHRLGLTVEEYTARRAAGLKWCTGCRTWRPVGAFGQDRTRQDGQCARCFACSRVPVRVCTAGRVSAFRGHTHTPEARRKMSEARRGNTNRAGKPCTPDQRARISEGTKRTTPCGPRHPRWKGGVGAARANRGLSPADVAWRTAVFARDGYTCQHCGCCRGGNLNAHHIKAWATHPELRHLAANGITLCEPCHDVVHYGRPRRR